MNNVIFVDLNYYTSHFTNYSINSMSQSDAHQHMEYGLTDTNDRPIPNKLNMR